jgi:thiosulfate/3-mercaptopyruvate sulfurtransferase
MISLSLPLIVEADVIEAHLGAPELLIVDLSEAAVHAQGHVPDAVHLDYPTLIAQEPPAMGMVPDNARLSEAFSAIGMTPASHVVAYDDAGNTKAGRLLWTLDLIGHAHASLLNGGLHAWSNEGHAVEGGETEPRRSAYKAVRGAKVIADKAYVLAHLGEPDVVVLDARTPAEFSGADRRAARAGHIPGAVNLDWMLAVDTARNMRLKPEAELRALLAERGVTPDKEIIPHCQTHHRSSHVYVVLKALGYPRIRAYAGSWSEWGNDPALPVET